MIERFCLWHCPKCYIKIKRRMTQKWKTTLAVATVLFVGKGMAEEAPQLAPLHDIVGPWAVRSWSASFILGIAVAVIAAGLVLAWVFLRARHQSPPPLPREVAQRALDALRAANVPPYEASVRVSDILRRFIHDEYGLDAINKTSMEFLNELQPSMVFSENERVALAGFLEAADLIKFARAHATTQDTEQLFATAEQLINTKKEEEEKDAVGGAI